MSNTAIYITLDYEIFFGPNPGTVEKCLLEPTQRLIDIASRNNVTFTFFVDSGMLCTMHSHSENHPELAHQYDAICKQIKELEHLGHSVQLHIHPHWEDAIYQNGKWKFNVSRYRIEQFSHSAADTIIRRYHAELQSHIQHPLTAFRAGGWCIQPFTLFRNTFLELGIKQDSSLFDNGLMKTASHNFDFRGMPKHASWRFSTDPMVEDPDGEFIEIPIASTHYSQFFYSLMLFSRIMKQKKFTALGDGHAIGGGRWRQLRSVIFGDHGVVSLDTFRCRQIESALRKFADTNPNGHFVIIGHPKALSEGSFEILENLTTKFRSQFNTL